MMDNINIITFKKEHADYIISNPMNDPLIQIQPQFKKYALFLEIPGMSFSATKDGKLIVSGGIGILWDNVAEGWVLATGDVWKNPIGIARHIKKKLDILTKTYKVKRLQTAVKADFVLGIKFAEWLGLQSEGLMKHYGPDGADYIRFAKIY